jgi:hypothetical protein
VQKRAARFVLNNYSYEEGSMSEIMEIRVWYKAVFESIGSGYGM